MYTNLRIGNGYDIHKMSTERKLILGGVEIPHDKGLLGHSDADVLIHSIIDALLGAAALGDIGKHFPDTDKEYKNISSVILLENVIQLLKKNSYKIINIDTVIQAEKPKLLPFITLIQENLANFMEIDISRISIKATTMEGLGEIGSGNAIATYTVALLYKNQL